MSSLTTLARPYAKAAFELAQGEQSLAGWDDMLSLASETVAEESMAALLESPYVTNTQLVGIISGQQAPGFASANHRFVPGPARRG
jgi:F-type H+-transporting ATPase subunit delta